MKPKFLIFLFMIPYYSFSMAGNYSSVTNTVYTDDLNPAPSCEVVKLRLQEFARRSSEASIYSEWFSPVGVREEQKEKLLEMLKRAPFLNDDRIYEHLTLITSWLITKEDAYKHLMSEMTDVSLRTGRFNWNEHNAYFPSGAKWDISFEYKVISLEQKMSFEQYCLGDTKIKLSYMLVPQNRFDLPVSYNFEAEYDPGEL